MHRARLICERLNRGYCLDLGREKKKNKKSQTANEHPQISNENDRLLYRLQLHFGISVWEYILQSKLNPLLNQPPSQAAIQFYAGLKSLPWLHCQSLHMRGGGGESLQSISESLRWAPSHSPCLDKESLECVEVFTVAHNCLPYANPLQMSPRLRFLRRNLKTKRH